MTIIVPDRLRFGDEQKKRPMIAHPVQLAYRDSAKRFNVVPAGRRSGKTARAKRRLLKRALLARPTARFFAAAPTRAQAKTIYWDDLKAMIPRAMMRERPRETELKITLLNGVEIHVLGLDQPQRIEGSPWDGGILDEFANMKPAAWEQNVRPALSDRKGWCDLIGVPEGRNHYYDLWKYALSGGDPEWAGFTWKSADILDPEEIASAERNLDPLVFRQEYEASFENFEGRAYYNFTEAEHGSKRLRHLYDTRQPLILCFDFNVAPGVAAIVQELTLPGQFERDQNGTIVLNRPIVGTAVLGEVYIERNSNTPAVCRKLIADWGAHQGSVYCYGDPSGGARHTTAVHGSDWQIIRDELLPSFGNRLRLLVKSADPGQRARINATNSRLKNRVGEIRLLVDPVTAPHVVKDYEGVRVLAGGSGEIDKDADPKLTHLSDGIAYYLDFEFPIAPSMTVKH